LEGVRLRKPLTPQELIELDQALTEVFALHRALKTAYQQLAISSFHRFQPSLRNPLSLSQQVNFLVLNGRRKFGGSVSDVQLSNAVGQTQRVEVKSTASHAFQEFKLKDLLADTLVWICFGKRFHEGYGTIQIVILDNPGAHILKPVRLDIPRLMRRIGDTSDLRYIEVANFEEFLLSSVL